MRRRIAVDHETIFRAAISESKMNPVIPADGVRADAALINARILRIAAV
jgi:hypothetical protein